MIYDSSEMEYVFVNRRTWSERRTRSLIACARIPYLCCVCANMQHVGVGSAIYTHPECSFAPPDCIMIWFAFESSSRSRRWCCNRLRVGGAGCRRSGCGGGKRPSRELAFVREEAQKGCERVQRDAVDVRWWSDRRLFGDRFNIGVLLVTARNAINRRISVSCDSCARKRWNNWHIPLKFSCCWWTAIRTEVVAYVSNEVLNLRIFQPAFIKSLTWIKFTWFDLNSLMILILLYLWKKILCRDLNLNPKIVITIKSVLYSKNESFYK